MNRVSVCGDTSVQKSCKVALKKCKIRGVIIKDIIIMFLLGSYNIEKAD